MLVSSWEQKSVIFILVLIGMSYPVAPKDGSGTLTQGDVGYIRLVRVFDTDSIGFLNPAGLAYSPRLKVIHLVEAPEPNQPLPPATDIIKIDPTEDHLGSTRISVGIKNPINMAYDDHFNRLLLLQSCTYRLIEISEDPVGDLDATSLVRHSGLDFGVQDAQGMTLDPSNGHLYVLDAAQPEIVHVVPEPAGGFEQSVITVVTLQEIGLVDPRGISFDPTTGHLHILSPSTQTLYEVTQTGQLVATRDLSEFEIDNPQGIIIAPSGDLTDEPTQMSLYLADSGPDVSRGGLGKLMEFSFAQVPSPDQ